MNWKLWALVFLLVGTIIVGTQFTRTMAVFSDQAASTGNSLPFVWYDFDWGYRQKIRITNTCGSDLTDYQVKLTLNLSALAPTKMKTTGADIRFTTSDGMTSLPYWIESESAGAPYVDLTSAIIWVKIPLLTSNPTTTDIYMYYGNASAAATTSGPNTFIFFDDFETGLANWTKIGSGSISQTTAQKKHGLYSMSLQNTAIAYASFPSQDVAVAEFWIRQGQNNRECQFGAGDATFSAVGPYMRFTSSGAELQYNNNAYPAAATFADFSPSVSYSSNTWYTMRIDKINWRSGTRGTYDFWSGTAEPPTLRTPQNLNFYQAQTVGIASVGFRTISSSTNTWVDLVKVRKYASVEPTSAFNGAEE